jgi:integrase
MKNLDLFARVLRDAAIETAPGQPTPPFVASYDVSDEQIISELAAALRLAGANPKTVDRAEHCLGHYSGYLRDKHGVTVLTAEMGHVLWFMDHLALPGGERPHERRDGCSYCRERGYPSPDPEGGWSLSTRKSYFAYLRLVYGYCIINRTLPSLDPTAGLSSPKVPIELGPTLSRDELRRLLGAPGSPNARLIPTWIIFAPSRLSTFAKARWMDIDLDSGTWRVVGKGRKPDVFALNSLLVALLRDQRERQRAEAETNPQIRAALAHPSTAFVLMTRKGKPMTASQIAKMLKWHAVRARVGVIDAVSKFDAVSGKTSWVSPHVLRRTWAHLNLNGPEPQDSEVVRAVLNHISPSTLRHYAQPKTERAQV